MRLTPLPGEDWRAALASVRAGDELLLRPGEHIGGVTIHRGGTSTHPVVIGALDPASPPRLTAPAVGPPVLQIDADHVVVRGLAFGPTPGRTHALVIHGASHVAIEDCTFDDVGGLAIVETMNARQIVVRRNRIQRSRATAVYFGCHTGSCSISDLLIEGNRIEHVTAPWRAVGYGIQVKLNSCATIRDNIVIDTKGPPIMVYGAHDGALVSVVEGNLVAGSRRASGIVVGGGPAVVRDNIAVHNARAGISIEDYDRRGLLRAIEVRHNTLYGNRRGGIERPRGLLDAIVSENFEGPAR